MKISVISPTYNAATVIQNTYLSVMSQKNVALEYWIIDGGSDDTSLELFKRWSREEPRFHYVSEKDKGIYDAINKGTCCAEEDYVIVLGAGDKFCNDSVLEKLVEQIGRKTSDVIYGYSIFCYQDGRRERYSRKLDFFYPVHANPISHQAICVKRQLSQEYPYDLRYRIAADQDWIMKMYRMGKKFCYIDLAMADYDMTGISSTESGFARCKAELDEIQKTYYPMGFIIHSIFRKIRRLVRKKN